MKKRGFTIIEVVLVLAIAGLIFLMVFIALPALQRSQRDTQRRNDVGRVSSAIQTYVSRNNKLPFGIDNSSFDTNFVPRYIDSKCEFDKTGSTTNVYDYYYKNCGSEFTAPDGNIYKIGVFKTSANYTSWDKVDRQRIYVMAGAKCGDGENEAVYTGNSKDYIVAIKLEGKAVYCVDNT